MIRRFCFSCLLLFVVSTALSSSVFAQFLSGAQNMPHQVRKTPQPSMLNTWAHYAGKTTPLAKPFATLDTFDFGGFPENQYEYGTFAISNSSKYLAQLLALPISSELMEFTPIDDTGLLYPYIFPKATTTLHYTLAIDAQTYENEYPDGGPVAIDYLFYYVDTSAQFAYQGDTVTMVANPLPYERINNSPVIQLEHRKTQSYPFLVTSLQVPGGDITQLPSITDTFYLKNIEKDSLEVTTAQFWGNVLYTGGTERTVPFKLGPGELATVIMHFSPGVPDTQETVYPDGHSEFVPYYYDEFVVGTENTIRIDFASNVTASGYHPSRLAVGSSALAWQHPDPAANESAPIGSSYHLQWNVNGAPTPVNVEYAYQTSGTQTWKSITKNSNATSYDWTLPSTPGTIDIRVASTEQGVSPMVTHLALTSNAGVSDEKAALALQVYPNPVASTLRISAATAENVTLLDMLGRVALLSKTAAGKATLDCSKLAVGNYLLRVGSEVRPVTIAR